MKSALIKIPEEITRLIAQHEEDLNEAWAAKEADESLNVSFSAKIGMDTKGRNFCEVSISFIKDRIKDGVSFFWNDRQLPLLKEIKKMDDSLKADGISMTVGSPGHKSVILGAPPSVTDPNLKVPCLDCKNDQTNGGDCERIYFYTAIDGSEWICDQKVPLIEDENSFYTQSRKKGGSKKKT